MTECRTQSLLGSINNIAGHDYTRSIDPSTFPNLFVIPDAQIIDTFMNILREKALRLAKRNAKYITHSELVVPQHEFY